MIKAIYLRIDNLVYLKTVAGNLIEWKIQTLSKTGLDECYIGISLNESWFSRAGFSNMEEDFWANGQITLQTSVDTAGNLIITHIWKEMRFIEIHPMHFVHELQNLVLDITGDVLPLEMDRAFKLI